MLDGQVSRAIKVLLLLLDGDAQLTAMICHRGRLITNETGLNRLLHGRILTVLGEGPARVFRELICCVSSRWSRAVVLVGFDSLVHIASAEAAEVEVVVIRTSGKRIEAIIATKVLLRRVHAVSIG